MIVIPGPASKELGAKIASELGVEPHFAEYRVFPDGESYIRLTRAVEGETAVIVQTTAPMQDRKLMQLYMMASTAKELGARRVVCVVPYLAYSRQDKRFLDGEALSLELVIGILESLGVDDIIVVDIHNEESMRTIQSRHNLKVHNLSAIPVLAGELRDKGFEGAYSLSPDKGAVKLAEAASKILGGRYGFFEKFRDRNTGEIEMKVVDLDVEGESAIVFDDIVSSGGTMAKAVEGLKGQGAERVAAACTHALFMEGVEEKIEKAGADIIMASDTLCPPKGVTTVSVAPLVANLLRKLTTSKKRVQ